MISPDLCDLCDTICSISNVSVNPQHDVRLRNRTPKKSHTVGLSMNISLMHSGQGDIGTSTLYRLSAFHLDLFRNKRKYLIRLNVQHQCKFIIQQFFRFPEEAFIRLA